MDPHISLAGGLPETWLVPAALAPPRWQICSASCPPPVTSIRIRDFHPVEIKQTKKKPTWKLKQIRKQPASWSVIGRLRLETDFYQLACLAE